MNTQCQTLAERLRREIAEYGQLLKLFEEQQKLIFRNAPHYVLESTRAIEAQVQVLDRERRSREDAVAAFASGRGQPGAPTLRSLLPFVDDEARPLLKAMIAEINLLIHRVRRDSRRNHRLLHCVVQCHQELLRRLRPDAFTKTYAPDGRVSVAAIRPAAAVQVGG
jgi:flagellar biosynthesis/type III secretory pathway chaperone